MKKQTQLQVSHVSFKRNFKIAQKLSAVESFFSNLAGKISIFYNPAENSIRCISMFRKVAFLEISRTFFLTRVVGLKSTYCDANELLSKLLEGIWNILENLEEELCNRVSA